jgi:hypothetical protein
VTSKAVCVVVFTLGLAWGPAAQAHLDWSKDPRLRSRLGPRVVDAIEDADHAEIVRTEDSQRAGVQPALGGYPLRGAWRPVPAAVLDGLRTALLDVSTYLQAPPGVGIGKGCVFRPGVAVRFWPKASKAKAARPADVLFCFHCGDLALVDGQAPAFLVPFDPGRERLLELAAAALPDFEELGTTLAFERGFRAREQLFASMFPADVLLVLERASAAREGDAAEAVAALRRHAGGKALFALAARALGAKGNDLYGTDGPTAALYEAVRTLSAAEVLAGLEAVRGDQVALAGAGELLLLANAGAFAQEATRAAWAPALLEALLVRNGNKHCELMRATAERFGKPVGPLLVRVLRGQVTLAVWPQRRAAPGEPTDAGCALLALAGLDEAAARIGLATWRPQAPADALAVRAVKVRLGDDAALDAELFAKWSPTVARVALDGIEAHPSRHALDVVSESGMCRDAGVDSEGERLFVDLTGTEGAETESDPGKRLAMLQAWWAAHRDAWSPPASSAR